MRREYKVEDTLSPILKVNDECRARLHKEFLILVQCFTSATTFT